MQLHRKLKRANKVKISNLKQQSQLFQPNGNLVYTLNSKSLVDKPPICQGSSTDVPYTTLLDFQIL